jgi:Tfp pilus assembly protein PilN
MNLLELESGTLVRVRRPRRSESIPPIASTRKWDVVDDEGDRTPAVVAAAGATGSRRFEMVPESMRRSRAMRDRRVAMLLVMFACVNLLSAAVVYCWRLERQLDAVVARRAAIQPRALLALALRDSAQSSFDRAQSIARLEQSAPRWSAVLSQIAIASPEDVELSSIRAEADSIVLEGQSNAAARIVSILRRAPGVTGTKMTTPILRELNAEGGSIERWRLALRVDHRAAVKRR